MERHWRCTITWPKRYDDFGAARYAALHAKSMDATQARSPIMNRHLPSSCLAHAYYMHGKNSCSYFVILFPVSKLNS